LPREGDFANPSHGPQLNDVEIGPTPDLALTIFFQNEQRQKLTTWADLQREAEVFLRENPLVDRDGFMRKLKVVWDMSGNQDPQE